MACTKLCDVSPASKNWCVRALIARMWDYCGGRDGQPPLHLDLVLVDQEGHIMYAEAGGRDVDEVRGAVQEGGVYLFSKFLVVNMKSSYKPFCAKYMIKLTPWTKMDRVCSTTELFPRFVFHLSPLSDLSPRVGSQTYFTDVMAMIIGVSNVTYIRIANNSMDTPRRVIALKDLSGFEIKLVLWGNRAIEFDAEAVHQLGQEHAVVGVFVGTLVKSYRGEETLSGGSACKWYLNEDIAELDEFFERLGDDFTKICWISDDEDTDRHTRKVGQLLQKTVSDLRALDPWEVESTNFLCTVTVVRLSTAQPWWFSSCARCHRAATPYGSECTGGCAYTSAVPKYRVCLICSDGTAAAEFVLFGKVAQQIIGKPVMSLMKNDGIPREIAAIVSQKFTFIVSVSQRSLMQRVVSFQVNGIESFLGRQACVPDIQEYDDSEVGGGTSSSSSSVNPARLFSIPPTLSEHAKHASLRRMPLITKQTGGSETKRVESGGTSSLSLLRDGSHDLSRDNVETPSGAPAENLELRKVVPAEDVKLPEVVESLTGGMGHEQDGAKKDDGQDSDRGGDDEEYDKDADDQKTKLPTKKRRKLSQSTGSGGSANAKKCSSLVKKTE